MHQTEHISSDVYEPVNVRQRNTSPHSERNCSEFEVCHLLTEVLTASAAKDPHDRWSNKALSFPYFSLMASASTKSLPSVCTESPSVLHTQDDWRQAESGYKEKLPVSHMAHC